MSFPIIVMGVSGCGKSSVGEGLAAKLGRPYIEGDALHPPENVAKMSAGAPLTDNDRWPWLDRIAAELASMPKAIATCSSLKAVYRDRLRTGSGGRLGFIYLHGTRDLLIERMGERTGHFMPLSLLDSQLATLEPPIGEADVLPLDIDATVDELVDAAAEWVKNS